MRASHGKGTLALAVLVANYLTPIVFAATQQQVNALVSECNSGKRSSCEHLAKIAVNEKDVRVRILAVASLTDQILLAKIAEEDSDASVRLQAFGGLKVPDPRLLAIIATSDGDARLRMTAVGHLKDQQLLAKTAVEDKDDKVRMAAARKLTDQSVLAKVATEDNSAGVRSTAAAGLNDPQLLTQIAVRDKDPSARLAAVRRLTDPWLPWIPDQSLLARVVLGDKDDNVWMFAARRLTDQSALIAALKDADAAVRGRAAAALGQMRTPRAAEALRSALLDPDGSVREQVTEALQPRQVSYIITDLKRQFCPTYTQTDVTIEATNVPGRVLTNGHNEVLLGGFQQLTWCENARHTIKGKVELLGYTFVSDYFDPLVFTVSANRGYLFSGGRGTVIAPSHEKVFLCEAPGCQIFHSRDSSSSEIDVEFDAAVCSIDVTNRTFSVVPWDGKEWKPKTTLSWEDGTELVKFYEVTNHVTMAGFTGGTSLDDRIKTISDVNRERALFHIETIGTKKVVRKVEIEIGGFAHEPTAGLIKEEDKRTHEVRSKPDIKCDSDK